MTYTASTVKKLRQGRGTQYKKLADEFAAIEAQLDAVAETQSQFSTTTLRTVIIDPQLMKRGVGSPPGEGIEDGFPTLDFDNVANEEVFFDFNMPHDYNEGGNFYLAFDFFGDTSPSGDEVVRWCIEYKKLSHGDIFDFESGTLTFSVEHTISATYVGKELSETKNLEEIDASGWLHDDVILLRLFRDATHSNDNYGDDARLLHTHIHYDGLTLAVN